MGNARTPLAVGADFHGNGAAALPVPSPVSFGFDVASNSFSLLRELRYLGWVPGPSNYPYYIPPLSFRQPRGYNNSRWEGC